MPRLLVPHHSSANKTNVFNFLAKAASDKFFNSFTPKKLIKCGYPISYSCDYFKRDNPFRISTSLGSKVIAAPAGALPSGDDSTARKWLRSCCGVTLWRSAMKHTASSVHSVSCKSGCGFIVILFSLMQNYTATAMRPVTIRGQNVPFSQKMRPALGIVGEISYLCYPTGKKDEQNP